MSKRITYQDKTNPTPVVDRSKQATAQDFNDIKDVVNTNAEELDGKPSFSDITPVVANLITNANNIALAASQGLVLKGFIDSILSILNSDDISLDELQEVVNFIKQNRDDLQNLSINNIAGLEDELEQLSDELNGISTEIARKVDYFSRFRFITTVADNLSNMESVLSGVSGNPRYYLLRTPTKVFFVIKAGFSELDLNNCAISFLGGTSLVVTKDFSGFNQESSTDTYKVWDLNTTGITTSSFSHNLVYRFNFWRKKLDIQSYLIGLDNTLKITPEAIVIGEIDDFQDSVKSNIIRKSFLTSTYELNQDSVLIHNLSLDLVTDFKLIFGKLLSGMPSVFTAEEFRSRGFVDYVEFTSNSIVFFGWDDLGINADIIIELTYVDTYN